MKAHVLARQQVLRHAHRVAGRRSVVAEDEFERPPAHHAARGG
jgi:hypothetical protein